MLNERPFHAGSKTKGAADTVWRQLLRAEAGTNVDYVVITVLWDMTKYYETMDLQMLWRLGVALDFPAPILRSVSPLTQLAGGSCLGVWHRHYTTPHMV